MVTTKPIRLASGWYASYWNAFLFYYISFWNDITVLCDVNSDDNKFQTQLSGITSSLTFDRQPCIITCTTEGSELTLFQTLFCKFLFFWQTDSAHLSRRKMTSKIALTDSIRRSHTKAFKRLSLHTKRFQKWNYWVATGIHTVHCAGVTGVFSLCLWVSLCHRVQDFYLFKPFTFVRLYLYFCSDCLVKYTFYFTMVPPRTATNF